MRYLFAFLCFPVFLSAQDDDILVVRIAHSCSYEGEERASDYYTFKPSTEADRIVQEICDAKGLAKNFVVRSANVNNAVATMDADGRRVILYSSLFLEKFKSDPDCPTLAGQAALKGCPEQANPAGKAAPTRCDGCPEMVSVSGGRFTMGCQSSTRDRECDDYEKPPHEVTVRDFYIGKYEVTQSEWLRVMGSNPSIFKDCDNCPVENVSWNDVQEFIKKLNAQTGKNYRLPTEAEWEYAARGGSRSQGYLYSGSNTLADVGWYDGNSGSKTKPVGTRKANELGIYDMSGNVLEWVEDDLHRNYTGAPTDGRAWVDSSRGSIRVHRGGNSCRPAQYCRAAYRGARTPELRGNDIGFRLALQL